MNDVLTVIDLGFIFNVEISVPKIRDWKLTLTSMTEEHKTIVERFVNLETMKIAATVMAATKANFWVMNHHTGQGDVQGYIKKVLDIFYKEKSSEQITSAAHNLFASTFKCLSIYGMQVITLVIPVIAPQGITVVLSFDAKLRFSSMPAGIELS